MRHLLLCLLTALALMPAADVVAKAQAVQGQAEADLATLRADITKARSALMQELQAAHQAATAARNRATTAAEQLDELKKTVSRREREQRREQSLTRALLDRVTVAAGLPHNDQASGAQRIASATSALAQRIKELPQRLGASIGQRRIADRNGVLVDAPVLALGEARSQAIGSGDTSGLLALTGDGETSRVVGPPGITSTSGFPATILFDPDGTAATTPAHHGRSLAEWVAAGRAWIWPIIVAFFIGISTSIWRGIALAGVRINPKRLIQVADHLHRNQDAEAAKLVADGASPLDRVLAVGIKVRAKVQAAREAALEQALLAETPRMQKGLGVILVMASIAPLLGLLGTVTGMIDMFGVIASQGSGNAKALSGGISEALICTQAGMICAIPLLLIHALLSRISDRRLLLLEEAACGVLGLAADQDRA